MKKTFFCYNHQGKADAFVEAFRDAGYSFRSLTEAEVILMDIDIPGRMNRLTTRLKSAKARSFCYPHSARPFLGWDGFYKTSQYTTAVFCFTEGHREVLARYGLKKPTHAVGWGYSELRPFLPRTVANSKLKVLFAPIHPNRNGTLPSIHRRLNANTFTILLDLLSAGKIDLKIRYLRELSQNGLWADDRVTYIQGETKLDQVSDMDEADVVVSHETYAHIAVARGIPTVMMGEWYAHQGMTSDGREKAVDSWDKYKDLLMFPLDILATKDPYELLLKACESDEDIRDWRERMIGCEPFNGQKFIEYIESYFIK